MWYGTREGLNKFDGYKFIPFKHDPKNKNSLVSDDISCLSVQKNGMIWIGTRMKGLNLYSPYSGVFTVFQHDENNTSSLSDDRITALYTDEARKIIWVGTSNGLNCYDLRSGKINIFKNDKQNNSSISDNYITAITKDKNGMMWIGTRHGGLNVMDFASKKFTAYWHDENNNNSISVNCIRDVFADKENTIWIATPNCLNSLNPTDGKFKIYKHDDKDPFSISSNDITSVYQDKYGKIWAGTALDGLCVYYPKTGKFFCYSHEKDVANSLSSNKINSVSQGRSGMFWAATSDGGLNSFNPKTLKFNLFKPILNTADENIYEKIQCLHLTKNKNIFIGTKGAGVFVYNTVSRKTNTYKINSTNNTPSAQNINCFYENDLGQILSGTDEGLFEFNLPEGKFKKIILNDSKNLFLEKQERLETILPQGKINCIYKSSDNFYWIGTDEGLYKLDEHFKKINYYSHISNDPNSISDNKITCILQNKTGVIWVGTFGGGLNKLDSKTGFFTALKSENKTLHPIGANFINKIYEDKKGTIWVSTLGGGLNSLSNNSNDFICYTVDDGLPNNSVNAIMQDDSLNFWIGTDNGICRLSFSNNKLTQCRVFDLIDGLPTTEFYEGASLKNENGRMIFSCKKGLITFHPDSLRNNPYKPPVIVTDFQLFNKSVQAGDSSGILKEDISVTREINLKYNQNSFSFEFTAISFINPGKNKYAFKLEGFDKDWNYRNAQNRIATYTNLEPGIYFFKVIASNNDRVWNEKGTSIKIIICAPFWKTGWFILICILVLFFITFLIYRIRLQRLIEMERIRSSIARDLHDDMGSTLSSVSILSQLAINSQGKDVQLTKELINKIGDHSQMMLNSMDDIVWAINPKNDSLKNISVRMFEFATEVLEAKNINYTITVPEEMENIKFPMESRRDFYLIYKEALNNLAKYSECKNAEIKLFIDKNQLILKIKDNGIGFDTEKTDSGNGQRNMKERAKTLRGIFAIKSKIGEGTEIELKIPLN